MGFFAYLESAGTAPANYYVPTSSPSVSGSTCLDVRSEDYTAYILMNAGNTMNLLIAEFSGIAPTSGYVQQFYNSWAKHPYEGRFLRGKYAFYFGYAY